MVGSLGIQISIIKHSVEDHLGFRIRALGIQVKIIRDSG